nr:MAG TPA: hypothetical protein [Caudoviricetes sp.]
MIQEYLFGCDRHRRRKGKGESAERGGGLVPESWACGEEPYDCHL